MTDLLYNVSYVRSGHFGIHAGTDIEKRWVDVGNMQRMEALTDAELIALAQEVTGTDRSDMLESYAKAYIKWTHPVSFANCYAPYMQIALFPKGEPHPDDASMIYSRDYYTKIAMCPSIRQHVIAQIELWHFYDVSEGAHGLEPFERKNGELYSTRDGSKLVFETQL